MLKTLWYNILILLGLIICFELYLFLLWFCHKSFAIKWHSTGNKFPAFYCFRHLCKEVINQIHPFFCVCFYDPHALQCVILLIFVPIGIDFWFLDNTKGIGMNWRHTLGIYMFMYIDMKLMKIYAFSWLCKQVMVQKKKIELKMYFFLMNSTVFDQNWSITNIVSYILELEMIF